MENRLSFQTFISPLQRTRWEESIYYSSSLRATRRRRFFFSSTGFSTLIPANSGSMRIRPQYSHTITFLWKATSRRRWGGIFAKQPPQESRSRATMASPLRKMVNLHWKCFAILMRKLLFIKKKMAFYMRFTVHLQKVCADFR